jgi:galactose oxidase-like protein/Kelch motif protein
MKVAFRHVLVAALLMGLAATGTIPVQAKAAGPGGWSSAPDLLEGHVAHTATLLEDGRVLIVGGTNARGVPTTGSEIFDPKANRWIRAASMRTARAAHTATRLSDGSVLVTGGRTGLNSFAIEMLATAQIYHPNSNSWTEASSMHVPRSTHSATRLHDGRVLVVGGTTLAPGSPLPAAQLEQAEVYDPRRDSWSFAGTGLPALSSQAATLMPNGMVLVTGGSTDMGFATTGAEVFDPATNRWQPSTWPMATPRYGHTASLLPDGRVVLVGGYSIQPEVSGGRGYPNGELLTTSEIFDLRGNTLVRVGYSTIPRLEHSSTLLRNGLVLVVGSAYASDADSQLFDPRNTADWVSTGRRMDRYLHTATLLGDGRVLVAGGYGVGSASTAWVYSPVSATTASTPTQLLQIGAMLLLVVVIVIGLAVAARRFNRRPGAAREPESEWIDS